MAAGELLTPTLEEYEPRAARSMRPWRLGSQVYVAFFGGVLAVTAIALFNSDALRIPWRVRWGILAIAVLAFAPIVALSAVAEDWLQADELGFAPFTLTGLAAYGGMYLLQRPWDRIHRSFGDGKTEEELYASLVKAGLAAVVVGYVLQGPIVRALT